MGWFSAAMLDRDNNRAKAIFEADFSMLLTSLLTLARAPITEMRMKHATF
jgi:hypothetical protein